jgi:hypothetical protein
MSLPLYTLRLEGRTCPDKGSDMSSSQICLVLWPDMSDNLDFENFQETIRGCICPVKGGHVRSFLVRTDLKNSLEIPLVHIWRIGQ